MEPGHMALDKARDIVADSGLFVHAMTRGRDMWFSPASAGSQRTGMARDSLSQQAGNLLSG
jgi:hypothetical protein